MKTGKTIDDFHIPVGRAVDELRRSRGALLSSGKKSFAFLPIESLTQTEFKRLKATRGARFRAVITGARAGYVGLTKTKADAVLSLDANELSFAQLRFLADPLEKPARLPALACNNASEADRLALTLAKYASLLPALFIVEAKKLPAWQQVDANDIKHYMKKPIIEIHETARAHMPMGAAEDCVITGFRQKHGTSVHLALVIGDITRVKNPLTRIHSSCITGDILGSLRCDCGDQLKLALDAIAAQGAGILVYLHQEGRGIGITNKLRSYALQEQGVDTYDANLMLGFEEDERDFLSAVAILKKLGVRSVRLLSNNPHKIGSLEKQGIRIVKRVPLIAKAGKHNADYLRAKAKKSGHLF